MEESSSIDLVTDSLWQEVFAECDRLGRDRGTAFIIFMNLYDEHKKVHGSFKFFEGKEYVDRMRHRNDYCMSCVYDYIYFNEMHAVGETCFFGRGD